MRKKLIPISVAALLLSVNGVFATWTFALPDVKDESVSIPLTFNDFPCPLFTVIYMVGEDVYLRDTHYDSSADYTVVGAPNGNTYFKGWVNANGVAVTSIPKTNVNDYTLYATWLNKYTINFIDSNGNLVYGEEFTEGTSKISAEGQAILDEWLVRENQIENPNHIHVKWSDYNLASASADIIVRPEYDYQGYLNMDPVYEQPDDGVADYYKVVAVDSLPAEVIIPDDVGGIPVKVIYRITNEDGESDWNNYENTVTKITIGKNVERLEWNSLAWTPNLVEVNLPNSLLYMDKNVFSRNDLFGNDKKKLTINFNGTMQEWKDLLARSNKDWDGGLQEGTIVKCTNGYFKLEKKNIFSSATWNEYPN